MAILSRHSNLYSAKRLVVAGQARRFDELSIRAGMSGILQVLPHLGMAKRKGAKPKSQPFIGNTSSWVRASSSGIVTNLKNLGDHVEKGDALAKTGSALGEVLETLAASRAGIIIGKQNTPLKQEGDTMFHITFISEEEADIVDNIQTMSDSLLPNSSQDHSSEHIAKSL